MYGQPFGLSFHVLLGQVTSCLVVAALWEDCRPCGAAFVSVHKRPYLPGRLQVEVLELPAILPAAESDNDDSSLDGPCKKYRRLSCSAPPPEVREPYAVHSVAMVDVVMVFITSFWLQLGEQCHAL